MTKKKTTPKDEEILQSWHDNADPWIHAIENKEIESRTLVTNQAIVEAVISSNPTNILDLGCGEGWLSKVLKEKGFRVFGLDAIPELIERAKKIDANSFDVCTYEDLPRYKFKELFDCVVCNFSLIGKESTEGVISYAPSILKPGGSLIVQTLHPLMVCGDLPYKDGWREGSWSGFSKDFKNPAPVYFRTVGSWHKLFVESGLKVESIEEPLHPHTGKPASIIFRAVRT